MPHPEKLVVLSCKLNKANQSFMANIMMDVDKQASELMPWVLVYNKRGKVDAVANGKSKLGQLEPIINKALE